jgi:hypothetical protein
MPQVSEGSKIELQIKDYANTVSLRWLQKVNVNFFTHVREFKEKK